MIDYLTEPFQYQYMLNAIWVSALVGALCAFLSTFLMLRGWSLIGDALSHAVVPGVAGAYMLGLPFTVGAFIAGGLASGVMLFLNNKTKLKQDTIIGLVFTSFFGLGLFMASLSPTSVNIQTIALGNILAIQPVDIIQIVCIASVSLIVLTLIWRDLVVVFFDENHAASIGINPKFLKLIFFAILAASTIAALQTVGAFLVVAIVVTPGATAYLLADRFSRLIIISVLFGTLTCALGAYLSYFTNGATGGVIVALQSTIFILTFIFAPKHGTLAAKRKATRVLAGLE